MEWFEEGKTVALIHHVSVSLPFDIFHRALYVSACARGTWILYSWVQPERSQLVIHKNVLVILLLERMESDVRTIERLLHDLTYQG
jgi:hypothetical protein